MPKETKWYDDVFNADKRLTNASLTALAEWLTIEQLERSDTNNL